MLGRHSPQGELFRPDNIHLDHVGRNSFYGFLATSRHQLFRDRDFAGLYTKERLSGALPMHAGEGCRTCRRLHRRHA